MSVKSFLDKYFKAEPTSSAKVNPEVILEPMVGKMSRTQLDYYKPSQTHTQTQTHTQNYHQPSYSNLLHIFTDGACSDNGKRNAKGGYGVHVYNTPQYDISARLLPSEQQTNNRAELRAIQAALDLIDQHDTEWSKAYPSYKIWSDSEYSINCLTKWAAGWRRNNWKKSDGGLIQNIDLIKPLYERLSRMPRVALQHVRAHQTALQSEFPFDGNHRADQLATQSLR